MGQFSWITSDTHKPITNRYAPEGPLPVWMLLPDGTKHYEPSYAGYGDFDGLDFYELVARINAPEEAGGDSDDVRGLGIDLWFNEEERLREGLPLGEGCKPLRFPKFVENPNLLWEHVPDSQADPNQGFGHYNE